MAMMMLTIVRPQLNIY